MYRFTPEASALVFHSIGPDMLFCQPFFFLQTQYLRHAYLNKQRNRKVVLDMSLKLRIDINRSQGVCVLSKTHVKNHSTIQVVPIAILFTHAKIQETNLSFTPSKKTKPSRYYLAGYQVFCSKDQAKIIPLKTLSIKGVLSALF